MSGSDLERLWGESLPIRDKALLDFAIIENPVIKQVLKMPERKKRYNYSPSKYVDSKFSHAVREDHPWRYGNYKKAEENK